MRSAWIEWETSWRKDTHTLGAKSGTRFAAMTINTLGFIGLGRMGASMVRRLAASGVSCVAFDVHADAVKAVAQPGITGVDSLAALVAALPAPRAIWFMVPAAVVDAEIARLAPLLSPGDIIIDGGNSNYRDDIRRAGELRRLGLHYVDVGTSGG